MSKYDRQLIAAFLSGVDDHATRQQARSLDTKPRSPRLDSEVVYVETTAAPALAFATRSVQTLQAAVQGQHTVARPITTHSRVYLLGTGDWREQSLAGCSAADIADLLGGLPLPSVKVISICSDELGRDAGTEDSARAAEPMNSFASNLHFRLGHQFGLRTVVHAHVYRTKVVSAPDSPEQHGRKVTHDEQNQYGDFLRDHHREHSKLKFFWERDQQRREWAY